MHNGNITEILSQTKKASFDALLLDDSSISGALVRLGENLIAREYEILHENEKDLANFLVHNDKSHPMYDRLLLNSARIKQMATQVLDVAKMPIPLAGAAVESKVMPSGIHVEKISVPFGVIAVIYESRPNVTIDVFALCFKTQNASLLKGGKETNLTNSILMHIIKDTLRERNINPMISNLITCDRENLKTILTANKYIDLCIPRGSKNLIEFVKKHATVATLETGAGVVHAYFSEFGDLTIGMHVIHNAKTRRVSVCNALDCLIVNQSRLKELPHLLSQMESSNVVLYCDAKSYAALQGKYKYLEVASDNEIAKEFLDYKMSIVTVANVEEAIQYINNHTSSHSECIISNNQAEILRFQRNIDASVIYVNTSTAFTDGGEFGMGAEIGISTQKLHVRGPVGANELRIVKYLVNSNGAIRQ